MIAGNTASSALARGRVEYVELGKVVSRVPHIRWSEHNGEQLQYIDLASVDRRTNSIASTSTINQESAPNRAQQEVRAGDVLFGTTRPMLKRYCLVDEAFNGQVASTGFCVLRPKSDVLSGWLYHVLGTKRFYDFVESNQRGASYPAISDALVKKFKIPFPPMAIQREVVETLDKIEKGTIELEAELQAELDARQRQFTIYRDLLLDFGQTDEVTWTRLGDVSRIARGASPRPIQAFLTNSSDGYPWIKIGDVPADDKYITSTAERVTPAGAEKSRRVRPGDFVLSNSMSFGRPYISQIEGCIHDGWLAISEFDETFTSDFLYHLLRSSTVQTTFAKVAGSGTVKNLNAEIVRAVSVPVPSRIEQDRVVQVVDRLEDLVRDLTRALSMEVQARRRQRDYYRDELLTFEEAK